MNFDSKKSAKDFKGQAMSKDQQKAVKGGTDQAKSSDFIIQDDVLDG